MPALLDRSNASFTGRLLTTAVLIAVTMPIYMLLNFFTEPKFDLAIPADRAVPFLPWTICVYLSFYALLLFAAAVSSPPTFSRIQKTVLLANFLCYGGFLLLPAHYPRPLPETAGLFEGAYRWLYSNDRPGNTFPSIHAAASLCTGFGMQGLLWKLWALAVAVSILTVKQHFIADLAGGVIVAALSIFLVQKYETKP